MAQDACTLRRAGPSSMTWTIQRHCLQFEHTLSNDRFRGTGAMPKILQRVRDAEKECARGGTLRGHRYSLRAGEHDDRPEIVVTTDEHDVNDQAVRALACDDGIFSTPGGSYTSFTTGEILKGSSAQERPDCRTCRKLSCGSGWRKRPGL